MSDAPQRKGATARSAWLSELSATLALSWPLVLANVAVNVMTATDFMMLGWLSPRALAAGSLGFNLYQPPFLIGIGVVAALSPIAAAKIGAGEAAEGVRKATHQALLSALLIAGLAWIALSQTTAILTAIGEPPDLARDAGVYMRGFQWGLAPNLMFFAGRSVFAALERPRLPLLAGLIAVAFNALANYALIFGKFGMPALGIIGSGLATTLSQTLMFALLIAFSLIDPRMRRLRLFALPWRPSWRELAALWRLGLPIGAMIAAEVGVFSASTLVMGLIGPADARSPHDRAADRLARFHGPARSRPGGDGAGRPRLWRARFGCIARAGGSAFGLTVGFRRAFRLGDDRRAAARSSRPSWRSRRRRTPRRSAIAVALLRVAAIFQIFDASQATLANMLRGLHDSRWPLLIALVGYWAIGAPIGVALGFATSLGGVGVWIGLASGLAVVAAPARRALARRGPQGISAAFLGSGGDHRGRRRFGVGKVGDHALG